MTHGAFHVPTPINEPVKPYGPGSPEKKSLKAELARMASEQVDVPLIIGGVEIRTGETDAIPCPHDHSKKLGQVHRAKKEHVAQAIEAADKAKKEWARLPWEERASVFLRVGELLATTWRDKLNASTMLGQSKTVHQAEIDAACEAIDFMRFNVHYAERLYAEQPQSSPGMWNRMEHRPLDGFVVAISPFNFTSIAANLPTAPAIVGNTVVWKPASTSILSNYYLMKLYQAAGLPAGVINFVPSSGATVGEVAFADRRFAGVHFTGSTGVFNGIWSTVGQNLGRYGQYPRLVGETGGKDFVFVHASAEARAVAVALVRGAFEYQGQKCSAASRAYVPKSLWPKVRDEVGSILAQVKVGDVTDFTNFMGAVIDKKSFTSLKSFIDGAKQSKDARIAFGGECDDSMGWFIQPTVIEALDPRYTTMCTELFGPVLTLHVYDDARFAETLELCATTSDYALTGAIFADDRFAVRQAYEALRFAAGNFYINDKPTGAVVGQQPFGGSRASGTNDKAGSILNLLRWISPRAVKETFVPPTDWRYPFLAES
ncbi:MAG: L-glutamate gamma-semialdehyde dehydrogenase [Planctomycetes bacterium]|nr:L-glutamate gamma-semialdehyde dehydrogenase [Planctomycetota bacterium]